MDKNEKLIEYSKADAELAASLRKLKPKLTLQQKLRHVIYNVKHGYGWHTKGFLK